MERSERETNIRNYAGYVKPLWGGKKSFWLYIQNGRIIEFSRAPILDGYVDGAPADRGTIEAPHGASVEYLTFRRSEINHKGALFNKDFFELRTKQTSLSCYILYKEPLLPNSGPVLSAAAGADAAALGAG